MTDAHKDVETNKKGKQHILDVTENMRTVLNN